MAEKGYTLSEQAVKRTAATVKAYYAGEGLGSSSVANPANGLQVIEAKLTSRDSTNTTLYAWSQARRSGNAWELVPGGLTGTTSQRQAIDTDETGATDWTNKYVLLARGMWKTADGDIVPCWYIVGATALGAGQYYGMALYTGADLAATWGWLPLVNRPPV